MNCEEPEHLRAASHARRRMRLTLAQNFPLFIVRQRNPHSSHVRLHAKVHLKLTDSDADGNSMAWKDLIQTRPGYLQINRDRDS